jgi:acetyltransferase-like isoleucine patch superfamily enzyme
VKKQKEEGLMSQEENPMTQRERIASGKLFTDMSEGLPEERLRAKERMYDFNHTRPTEIEKRHELMKEMFGAVGERSWIEPPIYFCYGINVFIGDMVYANFNLSLVDDYKIIIGNRVMFGPNVTIAVTGHPIDPTHRGYMYALPVTIGENVWVGAGAVICPGVTIGENTVIGAGSIVTKDIPANVVAAGNPCKVLREINEQDRIYYYKDRKIE